jgi:hypothetical protein
MPYIRKRFRWGASVLGILHHFSTPEVKALGGNCRKLIRDYCTAALQGEGYGASIIPFEMFEYGFVCSYCHTAEEWILEVVTFPDFGSPQCRRKPPREDGGHPRVSQNPVTRRRPGAARLIANLSMLYKKLALGPTFTKFWADTSTRISLQRVIEMLHKIRLPQSPPPRAAHIIELFKNLAEQQSHERVDVIELVRAKVNSAVWFLGPLWTYRFRRLRRARLDGLWDVRLFGALPEQ